MQKYVMILADKTKFILDDNERIIVFGAIQKGDSCVMLKDEMISLQIIPTIITLERWWSQENERLAVSGKRLCKKCLGVMMIEDKCTCWEDTGKGEVRHGIETPKLPDHVKGSIQQIADKKSFPKLDNWEKGRVEVEERAMKRLLSGRWDKRLLSGRWYEDPETGDKTYS